MPGPLLTYVINGSLRRGFLAGPLVVLGHALLELLLITMLLLGLNDLFASETFTALVGIIGGIVLLWMGQDMIKAAWKKKISIENETGEKKEVKGFVLPGAVISIANPYWILWWATIGMTYLASAYQQGFVGTSTFYIGHISADLIWYAAVSGMVAFGRKFLNDRFYRGLVMVFGFVLIYFAGNFIFDGTSYFLF